MLLFFLAALPYSYSLFRVTAHFLPDTFLLHAPQQSGGSLAYAVPKGAQLQGPRLHLLGQRDLLDKSPFMSLCFLNYKMGLIFIA